jgi:hypothetical protein
MLLEQHVGSWEELKPGERLTCYLRFSLLRKRLKWLSTLTGWSSDSGKRGYDRARFFMAAFKGGESPDLDHLAFLVRDPVTLRLTRNFATN